MYSAFIAFSSHHHFHTTSDVDGFSVRINVFGKAVLAIDSSLWSLNQLCFSAVTNSTENIIRPF